MLPEIVSSEGDSMAGGPVTTVLTVAVLLLLLTPAQAQTTYAMSDNAQCDKSGFEVISTGSSVRVLGKRDGATGDRLTCYVRLTTSDRESQLRLTYQTVVINDCDVQLHVTAQGTPATDTLTCGPMPTLSTKTSPDGNVVIRLDRRNINDVDYNFIIIVEAFKPSPQYTTSDSNPVAVGLVAGVVGGVLGFLVLLAILGVCCYKKVQRAKQRERERDYKENLAEIEGGEGYSNDVDQNGVIRNEEYHDSPRGKRKLLPGKRYMDDPRPDERSVDGPRSPVTPPAPPLPVTNMAASPSKKSAFDFDKPQMRKENGDAVTGKGAESKALETPKSPILAALHNNPKFRATFQSTEADAENRAQRISMYSTGGESQSSLASQTSSQAPPPLPSVPRVPKSPASRRQNHASIRRAQRLSSGDDLPRSSESEDDPKIQVVRGNPPPASPAEVVPIKTQDPHAAEPKKKFDTAHTLRPNRGKSPQTKKKDMGTGDAPRAARPIDLESVAGRSVASSQGGMFKKANSLRKRSGKSPRLGRASRSSVGNALDDMDGRPTTPTSMRGFDDEDDLDNYPPLKRTGSRQSLYASRSSLYNRRGRRERNNSIGESLYSFAHDDIDAYRYGQDSAYEEVIPRRMSRRSFRSLGDLEYAMRETATQTLRETATQTGKGQAFVSGSKLRASKKKSGSSKSLGAAIALSAADSETKETKKGGKDAGTSTGGTPKSARKKAASMDNLDAAKGKGDKPKRKKSVTKTTGTDAGGDPAAEIIAGNTGLPEASKEAAKPPKPKPKPKPRPLPRKSQSNPGFAGGEEEGEGEEAADGAADGGAPAQQPAAPTTAPSMPPQPGMMPMMAAPYIMTPQGLVLAQPYPHMQAMYPGAQPPQQPVVNPPAPSAYPPAPSVYPPQAPAASGGGSGRPSRTNWDLLCDLTGGQQAGQPSDIASVSGSVFSSAIPPYSQGYAGNYGGNAYPSSIPAYGQMSAGLSDHGSYGYEAGGNKHSPQSSSSSRGTPPMASSTPPPSGKKASWEALQDATDARYRLAYGTKSQASGGTESIV